MPIRAGGVQVPSAQIVAPRASTLLSGFSAQAVARIDKHHKVLYGARHVVGQFFDLALQEVQPSLVAALEFARGPQVSRTAAQAVRAWHSLRVCLCRPAFPPLPALCVCEPPRLPAGVRRPGPCRRVPFHHPNRFRPRCRQNTAGRDKVRGVFVPGREIAAGPPFLAAREEAM